jgi:hypothetical protein
MASPAIFNFQPPSSRAPFGAFRHWAGLQLASGFVKNSGFDAPWRIFHVPSGNASAIFRGDIVKLLGTGGGDIYQDRFDFGGNAVGNPAFLGDVGLYAPGDTASVLAGVVVGFELTLFGAKNGQQYLPATTEGWVRVCVDPDAEFFVTAANTALPTGGWAAAIGAGIEMRAANTAYQSTRYGISGRAVDPAGVAVTATLPLRVMGAPIGINNDVVDAPTGTNDAAQSGNPVISVCFNRARHLFGSGGIVA